MSAPTLTMNYQLNRLAGTLLNGVPQLHEQGAANKWAATSGLGLQGALNKLVGITNPKDYRAIRDVCNFLAGTTNQDPAYALSQV